MDAQKWYDTYTRVDSQIVRKDRLENISFLEQKYHEHTLSLIEYHKTHADPLHKKIVKNIPFYGKYNNNIIIFYSCGRESSYFTDHKRDDDIETLLKIEPFENLGLYTNIPSENKALYKQFRDRLDKKTKAIKRCQELVDEHFKQEHKCIRLYTAKDMYFKLMKAYIDRNFRFERTCKSIDHLTKMVKLTVNGRVYIYMIKGYTVSCISTPQTECVEVVV